MAPSAGGTSGNSRRLPARRSLSQPLGSVQEDAASMGGSSGGGAGVGGDDHSSMSGSGSFGTGGGSSRRRRIRPPSMLLKRARSACNLLSTTTTSTNKKEGGGGEEQEDTSMSQHAKDNSMSSLPLWNGKHGKNGKTDATAHANANANALANAVVMMDWSSGPSQRLRLAQTAKQGTKSSSSITSITGSSPSITSNNNPNHANSKGRSNNHKGQAGTVTGTGTGTDETEEEWMDWVASGIEFFGCDGDIGSGQSVIGRALMLQASSSKDGQDDHAGGMSGGTGSGTAAAGNGTATAAEMQQQQVYCRLHEDFFEALLKEQVERSTSSAATSSLPSPSSSLFPPPSPLEHEYSLDDSIGSNMTTSTLSSQSSLHTSETYSMNSASSTRTRMHAKRNRPPLRLTSSSRNKPSKISPIEAYDTQYNPANQPKKDDTPISSLLSSHSQAANNSQNNNNSKEGLLQEPSFYVHDSCILQKDKGKGESPLGIASAISARGKEPCLDKLRDKMKIVVQVSEEEAGVKKRPAKAVLLPPGTCTSTASTTNTTTIVETRSMIELRLGFLSMQYGLLLHWDTSCQKIVFMVLRKMCHDSFYNTKDNSKLHQALSRKERRKRKLEQQQKNKLGGGAGGSLSNNDPQQQVTATLPLVVRTRVGNDAIYQRPQATEVVLVDAPPHDFSSSVLSIKVHSISGLSKQSRWTLSMTFDGHTEIAQLFYNQERGVLESRRQAMTWQIMSEQVNSFDLCALEIRLFEQPFHRSKKHQTQSSACRLTSSMTLGLGELVAQPSMQPASSLQLTVPFTHDSNNTQLTLELTHESEYAHWLYQELQKKKHHHDQGGVGVGGLLGGRHNNDDDDSLLPSSGGAPDASSVSTASSVTNDTNPPDQDKTNAKAAVSLRVVGGGGVEDVFGDWLFCGVCLRASNHYDSYCC